jgi:mRNA interferase HigB
MRVIKPATIKGYWARHRDARPALVEWLQRVESARWSNLNEVRRLYPHADAAKVASGATVTIFNIKGNAYRLITAIHYNTGRVFIRDFLTHAQYSGNQWKERH